MGILGMLTKPFRKTASVTEDIGSAASDTIKTGVRKGTSPLSVAAVGGAGAYTYGEYTDVKEQIARTDRYSEYQERVATIEDEYGRGEISKARMEALKEEARNTYYASNDDDASNRGLTLTELVAQMGTIQLMATAAVLSAGLYFVARPIAQSIAENDVTPESILG